MPGPEMIAAALGEGGTEVLVVTHPERSRSFHQLRRRLPDRSLIKGSLLAPFCVPALHVLVSAEVAYTQRIPAPKLSCYHVLLSWTFTALGPRRG